MRHMTASLLLTCLAIATPAGAQDAFAWGQRNTDFQPARPDQFRAPLLTSDVTLEPTVIADGLLYPWGVEVLPDGSYLVTERNGYLRHVAQDGTISDPIGGLPEIVAIRQGGLLDVALAPDFAESRMVYWSYSKPVGRNLSVTAAARGRLSADRTTIENAEDIFVQTPASPTPMHYGSRVVFDDDGHVFITTGEHSSRAERVFAQHLDKSYGKVIRVNPDGSAPVDNPFVGQDGALNNIWSLGHRNIQGAFFADGVLWTVEHGPKGGDELNRPEPGLNYGWPVVTYGEDYNGRPIGDGIASAPEFEEPVYFWDPVIAPGGMHLYEGAMFPDWQGDILIASLNPGGLVRLKMQDGRVVGEERLLRDLGRVRDVEIAPDGAILVLTDDQNGALIRFTPSD